MEVTEQQRPSTSRKRIATLKTIWGQWHKEEEAVLILLNSNIAVEKLEVLILVNSNITVENIKGFDENDAE